MEVLAGESNLVTKVQGFFPCYFEFSMLKTKGIYWKDVLKTVPFMRPVLECKSWQLLLPSFVLVC